MWYLFINAMKNRMFKIIDLFHLFQFLEKYLNVLYTMKYTQFFRKRFNITSRNQSGFKQRDSFINQFLTITHALYQSLNQGFEVSGVYFRYFKGICQGLA